jgi:ubiquinone/menaquinone biosynthesis C-methylase UbiE
MQMDACAMTLPDCTFDLVHSRSVFHHIPDPGAALAQIERVLKPLGIATFSFHLYTSENGSLDPRVYTSDRGEVSGWPHLRKTAQKLINANAYLNKFRLAEWRAKIFASMPGAEISMVQNSRPGAVGDAEALRQSELQEFSMEELLTDEVSVVWQKPNV